MEESLVDIIHLVQILVISRKTDFLLFRRVFFHEVGYSYEVG